MGVPARSRRAARRLGLVAAAALGAGLSCKPEHTGLTQVAATDCIACHRSDYETASPPHPGNMPETCGDCHTTVAWLPALGGVHPESRFPTSGPHDMPCLDCHDPELGPSTGGQNTDCVGCHTGDHTRAKMDDKHKELSDYEFDPGNPHFCLACHPTGRKD